MFYSDNKDKYDADIGKNLHASMSFEGLSKIDKVILRFAFFEIDSNNDPEIGNNAFITAYIDEAKRISSPESIPLINAVLDNFSRQK
jgi:transcription termination factor NusB